MFVMRKYSRGKMVAGLIIGAIAIGATGAVYATPNNVDIKSRTAPMSAPRDIDGNSKGTNFNDLVAKGIIDQDTADKLTAYMSQLNASQSAAMTKIQSMTESERQAYFESNRDNQRTDVFAEAVNASVITQAQADAIKAAMPQMSTSPVSGFLKDDMGAGTKMNYDILVTSGVIDQETADKLTAFQIENEAERRTKTDEMQSMTEAEQQVYMESIKDNQRTDIFTEAVNAEVITQAQADAIKAAMPAPPTPPDRGANK